MLSALLRPFQGSRQADDHADLEHDIAFRPSVAEYRSHLHATADFTEADDDEEESNDGEQSRYPLAGRPDEDEDGMARSTGLLPRFSAGHLDSLPIYNMTHAIRAIVQARTETTLTWDQLRSPQVSQFLVKPMFQQIRAHHFSPGTLFALMANCLQFEKEGQLYPASAGTSATMARVCELLAIKMLREYRTRELIDALCHDFYPLQGVAGSQTPLAARVGGPKPAFPRTSTLEVAIRASAKHFVSHPLVVQQLEAIWNGAISFSPPTEVFQPQGSASSIASSNPSRRHSTVRSPLLGDRRAKESPVGLPSSFVGRRPVTLYNPRTASLFSLSRLRVPRYRQFFSTGSLAVLICLFLAVLSQRSSKITSLELLFWFWSAGFMLDELVGFNEQGLSFYVMSFWNIFDLGILLLLIIYYCMRIYGVFLVDSHKWNQNAYDVLAVNAILLLPRIFGVLDHSRYFSQLLIALRLLAIDLAAVSVLIFICCSGFFVFFAFSKPADNTSALGYKMFQILMGYTPSAWELWPSYNWLGKTLLGLFLVISHFIILTMLVIILSNSFMSLTSKASQEYHFTFAITTISMAKSDALFAYAAPGNLFAWALMPLRYCMPINRFVQLNRAVLRATHFPLLFCIYLYEKYLLSPGMFEATDLVDKLPNARFHSSSDPATMSAFFSPSIRVRQESVVGFHKDRALEEVFRRAPDTRPQRRHERRKTQTAIRTWMDQHDGAYTSPQNYSTINSRIGSDWLKRLEMNRERPSRFPRHYSDIRSTASDPADLNPDAACPFPVDTSNDGIARRDYAFEVKEHTDAEADGDDELVTNDEDEGDDMTNTVDDRGAAGDEAIEEDYFTTPVATRFNSADISVESPRPPTSRRVPLHNRTLSTNTILYAPEESRPYSSSSASAWPVSRNISSRPITARHTPVATPATPGTGRRSPRRSLYLASRPRSMIDPMSSRTAVHTRTGGLTLDIPIGTSISPNRPPLRRRSLADLAASANADAADNNNNTNTPSSLRSIGIDDISMPRHRHHGHSSRMMMLARMKSLEASLGDMVREMRTLRMSVPNTAHNSDGDAAEVGSGGSGSGGAGGSAGVLNSIKPSSSWDNRQHRHTHTHHGGQQVRMLAGSDPTSVSGGTGTGAGAAGGVASRGQALIEVAVGYGREREREREGGGGVGTRRMRGAVVAATANTAASRRGVWPGRKGGAWRSPKAEGGGGGTADLGIGGGSGSGVKEKGKERETVVGGGGGGSLSTGRSPDDGDELEVAASGLSL
ncbi:hypothetical protein N657DRAFT_569196 [Parathielavia appendiculata]|uniref:Calcium channel YVC1-like C-terminal transmembrane domain-containing protein n=1 Tax=Parathielavia appendiculata TaxID=2587402 RepID=A0AAN6U585_9PEZI|nr:hypothetical protein N657DRAFT_569196 [Parathielavia appendiculata]